MFSVGGGVALALLSAAGTQILLNEIGKLAPIPRGTIAVTSAGSLPVPYIFHAAALEIDERGDYQVTTESVQAVVREVLIKAAELGVTAVIMPLIGAGVAGLTPAESLEAILHGTAPAANLGKNFHLTIVIFDELIISRDNVIDTAERWQHGC
jgi:O-acetyl-ADP-ribose deacetylase (regulator of RNase III)